MLKKTVKCRYCQHEQEKELSTLSRAGNSKPSQKWTCEKCRHPQVYVFRAKDFSEDLETFDPLKEEADLKRQEKIVEEAAGTLRREKKEIERAFDFTWNEAAHDVEKLLREGKTLPQIYEHIQIHYVYPPDSIVKMIESVMMEVIPNMPRKLRLIHLELMHYYLFQAATRNNSLDLALEVLDRMCDRFFQRRVIGQTYNAREVSEKAKGRRKAISKRYYIRRKERESKMKKFKVKVEEDLT